MTDNTISDAERRWLEGALDIHTHTGPSICPRLMNDGELASAARSARMRGVVIKAPEGSTVERAAQIDDVNHGCRWPSPAGHPGCPRPHGGASRRGLVQRALVGP